MFGRIIDTVCGKWLEDKAMKEEDAVFLYWAEVKRLVAGEDDDYAVSYGVTAKDALVAWVKTYGDKAHGEDIVAIQPAIKTNVNIKIDYAVRTATGLRIRERKLVTGWADLDDEIAKYEMGFQPICYAEKGEEYFKEPIECVELEFLVRSVKASGKYKEKAAYARRVELFVEPWKKDMWWNSAIFTNETMNMLEDSLEAEEGKVTFASIPRFTRNCIQKIGRRAYPCEFYNYCKTNTNPLTVPEMFTCDREEATGALLRHAEGSGLPAESRKAPTLWDGA